MNEHKRLVPLILSLGLAGIIIGLFLGHNFRLPVFMLAMVGTWALFVASLQKYVAVGKNWNRFIIRAVCVGLIGIVTGLFIGGDLLPKIEAVVVSVKPPENEVWMINREFNPMTVTVPAGTTITWYNKDNEFTTVTSADGLFDAPVGGVIPFEYTFTKPGTYTYFCKPHAEYEPHSEAVGVVVVTE